MELLGGVHDLDLLKNPRKNKKYSPKGALIRAKIKNHQKSKTRMIYGMFGGFYGIGRWSWRCFRWFLERSLGHLWDYLFTRAKKINLLSL